ncbi:MAG: hypothetical protein O9345_16050 [Burkholderiaceae bacterium]|nr:hypothetical protein [Burkholderiales bacterium]MCZ8339638.1 hypothetical protein [Burkholderiaceae bacterium]
MLLGSVLPVAGTAADNAALALAVLQRGREASNAADPKEPWLFDLATTVYRIYRRSGRVEDRAEAMRLIAAYYALMPTTGAQAGIFSLANQDDTKYSYATPALIFEAEGGDQRFRPHVQAIAAAHARIEPVAYSPSQGFWTERRIAYAIGETLAWHLMSGDTQSLVRARTWGDQVLAMSVADGVPWHTVRQHQEGDDADLITSPWMGAILADKMHALHRVTRDNRYLDWIARYALYIARYGVRDGAVLPGGGWSGYMLPAYLVGDRALPTTGGWASGVYGRGWSDNGGWDDGEHAQDIAGLMARGVFAAKRLGRPASEQAELLAAHAGLRRTADYVFSYRTNATSPARKFQWWFGSTQESGWLLAQ